MRTRFSADLTSLGKSKSSDIILEIFLILGGQMFSSGLFYFQAGGIGHRLFIATQIVCLIAMLRFPLRMREGMQIAPPPLP